MISVTIKNVDEGTVSPYLVRGRRTGIIVGLGGVEGDFTLPDPLPEKLLFMSAGSGITPIMSMLRHLARHDQLDDVVVIHSARTEEEVIFGSQLRELDERFDGFRLHLQLTEEQGRFEADDLEDVVPDWKERETFLSRPAGMLDAMEEHFKAHELEERLHMERFQPKLAHDIEEGKGGVIEFTKSGVQTECDGTTPILVAGEEEGLELPYGCREGICHTCVGKLVSGQIRDLRNGDVHGNAGENVRTCIHAPEGPVEIEL